MQFYKNISDIPVHTITPDYERKYLRMTHQRRKKQSPPVLECGNASIVFQYLYTEQLYQDMEFWWAIQYELLGEAFNVELYLDTEKSLIELRFFSNKSFYKPTRRRSNSVLDDIDASVLSCLETLPEDFTETIQLCYLSDFDYLEPAEECFEEV